MGNVYEKLPAALDSRECNLIKRLQLLHQPDVEFHSPGDTPQPDLFVVAVDGGALFGGHIHGGEADIIAKGEE